MDLITVLKPFFDFFVRFCGTTVSLGGYSFTVGTVFLWCIIATILIVFLKGLAN